MTECLDLYFKILVLWFCPISVVVGKTLIQLWLRVFLVSGLEKILFGFCDRYFDASITN